MQKEITLFWFRRDLRTEDNVGFFRALKSSENVLPLFIFDTDILSQLDDKHDRRVDFIHRMVSQLHEEFSRHGSAMLVHHDKPLNVFKKLCENFRVHSVYTNHDYEPYAIQRDKQVSDFLQAKAIAFHSFKDQVIFEKAEVVKKNGEPYTIFTPYSKIWKNTLNDFYRKPYPTEKLLKNLFKIIHAVIPSLEEIGFKRTENHFLPPEINAATIKDYHLRRHHPAAEGTTRLSVHLRFGTVSVRKLVSKALQLNEQWLNEFIWREFFMMMLFHFPHTVRQSFKKKYERIEWRNDEREFEAWKNGMTGYPLVDAGMRELNATGFMHNRVRMVVASFLTKHLLIDWRWGEAYFAQKLLDFELSSNVGNWQWAAGCGCDAAPYFRIFNPAEQQKKFDAEMKYIRKWVPEVLSGDYPKPIVEHGFARERALRVYKKAVQGG